MTSILDFSTTSPSSGSTEFFNSSESGKTYEMTTYIYVDSGFENWYDDNKWSQVDETRQIVDRYSDYTLAISCKVEDVADVFDTTIIENASFYAYGYGCCLRDNT